MTKSPFVQQPDYVTKGDLNEFADQVQEKLTDVKSHMDSGFEGMNRYIDNTALGLKSELKQCIKESKDETIKEIKSFVTVFVGDEIKKSETRLSSQLKKVGADMLAAFKKA